MSDDTAVMSPDSAPGLLLVDDEIVATVRDAVERVRPADENARPER